MRIGFVHLGVPTTDPSLSAWFLISFLFTYYFHLYQSFSIYYPKNLILNLYLITPSLDGGFWDNKWRENLSKTVLRERGQFSRPQVNKADCDSAAAHQIVEFCWIWWYCSNFESLAAVCYWSNSFLILFLKQSWLKSDPLPKKIKATRNNWWLCCHQTKVVQSSYFPFWWKIVQTFFHGKKKYTWIGSTHRNCNHQI